MRYLIIFGIALVLNSCKNDATKSFNLNDYAVNDTVIFVYDGFNYQLKLWLTKENNFRYGYFTRGCMGGGEMEIVWGKYVQNGTKLTLMPDSLSFVDFPFNCHDSVSKVLRLKYGIDSLKIKTEYDIIQWKNTLYLISPQKDREFRTHSTLFLIGFDIDSVFNERTDYHEFAHYYNSGLEPKEGRYLTLTINNIDTSTCPPLDISQIPNEWKHLFLEKPIEATIMDITTGHIKYENDDYGWILSIQEDEDNGYIYKLVLDKGKKDNIRIGLVFYDKMGEKYVKIIDVEEDKSVGATIDKFSKGEKIRTNRKE